MSAKEELIAYIKSLTKEQADEALLTASAWLATRQEVLLPLQQTKIS